MKKQIDCSREGAESAEKRYWDLRLRQEEVCLSDKICVLDILAYLNVIIYWYI